jgi:hypothetical protein
MRFFQVLIACLMVPVPLALAQLTPQDPVWMAQQVPPSTINNGLTGYWKLNEGSGTNVFDSSGSGQNGTLKNTAGWATFGGITAVSFDGNTAYVNIPIATDLVGTNSVSVSAWLYPISIGENGKGYFFQTTTNGYPLFFGMTTDQEGFTNTVYTGSDDSFQVDGLQSPANSVALNQWMQVAILRASNTNTAIYINGILASTGASGTNTAYGATAIQIGNRPADLARGFDGGICGVRVWNRIITPAEISTIYNNGPANP